MSASRPWAILTLLVIAETISGFEGSMMLAGLGAWMRQYHDPIGVGWIVSSFFLVQAASAALLATLGDRFGRKLMLVIALAGALVGSLISAFAPSLSWIIVGRAVQGMAGALLPLCVGLAREQLPAERLPFAVGVIAAAAAISSAGGFMVGGVITDHFGPQQMFVAGAAAAAVALLLSAAFLPSSRPKHELKQLDILGGLLFVPGVTGLLLVLSNLGTWPAAVLWGVGLACLGLLGIWWLHERRHPVPLIDVGLFASRDVRLANLVLGSCALGAMGITQVSSILLQQDPGTGAGFGLSATIVGTLKLPMLIVGTLSSVWAGWASGRWSLSLPIVVGSAALVLGLGIGTIDHDALWLVILAVVVSNAGTTALFAGVPNVVVAAAPDQRTSEAVGLSQVVRHVFQAVGAQCIAVLLAASTVAVPGGHGGVPSGRAFTLVFAFMTLASLISLGAALTLRRGKGVRPAADAIAAI